MVLHRHRCGSTCDHRHRDPGDLLFWIQEEEQQTIVQANRGEAFFITSPLARTFLKIVAYDTIRNMFEIPDYTKPMIEKMHADKEEMEKINQQLGNK